MENLQPRLQNTSKVHFTPPKATDFYCAHIGEDEYWESWHRVIPTEKHPQQPEEKKGDPGLPSLPALSLGELSHMLPTVTPVRGQHQTWGLLAVTLPSRQH